MPGSILDVVVDLFDSPLELDDALADHSVCPIMPQASPDNLPRQTGRLFVTMLLLFLLVEIPMVYLLSELDDSPAMCRLGNLYGCLF